jgi:hypothetical protein
MFRNIFKLSLLKRNAITEKECFKSLDTDQLYEISRDFQHRKKFMLGMFLESLKQKIDISDDVFELKRMEEKSEHIWHWYRHYEELVNWVEEELELRESK